MHSNDDSEELNIFFGRVSEDQVSYALLIVCNILQEVSVMRR